MKYLVCTSGGVDNYYDLKPEQEEKLEKLYLDKKLPETFNLNGKMVITQDILGFSDTRPSELKIKDWDEFRTWAHRQSWYRKNRS